MENRIKSLLSRKFILALLGVIFITFFVEVTPEEKMEFITWIIGIYSATNVAQKFKIK